MTNLTKIDKALIVAQAIEDGAYDYFDKCERVAYAMWRYEDAQTGTTLLVSASELASVYDRQFAGYEA